MYSVHRYLCGWWLRLKQEQWQAAAQRENERERARMVWKTQTLRHLSFNWMNSCLTGPQLTALCVCVYVWEVYELCVWGLLVNIFNTRRIQPQYKAIKYFKPHALQRLSHPIQKPSWSSKWGGIFRSRLGNKSSTTTTTVYTASWRSGCNNNNNSACICVSVSGANVSEATATASVCGQRLSLDLYFVLSLCVFLLPFAVAIL